MKKVIIGIIIAVVVVAAGIGGYTFIKKKNADSSNENQSNFQPSSTDGQPFIATTTVTPKKGAKTVTVMKTDGQGNSEYVLDNSNNTKLVFTDDFYYTCSRNKCSKIASTADMGFVADPKSHHVSQAEINNAQENAQFESQQPCPDGGTCDVWKANAFNDSGSVATIYMETASRRVVQINVEDAEGTKTVTKYKYEPVNIQIPSNAREITIKIPDAPEEE